MEKRLFTSESVTEGHPDKMCDAISDAILDALMEKDPMSRVACETASCTGFVLVTGEITTNAYVDIPKIVRETVKEIGYDKSEYGFDGNTCAVMVSIDEQSSDIAMGVDKALEAKENQMSEEELEDVAEVIAGAKKPLIVVGGGVRYSEAGEAVEKFCEEFKIPFGETQAGKSACQSDNPYCLGGIGVTGTYASNIIGKDADVVISIGSRMSDFTTSSKHLFQNKNVQFVSINNCRFHAYKMDAVKAVGDAKATVEALAEKLRARGYKSAYTDEIEKAKAAWDKEMERLGSIEYTGDDFEPLIKARDPRTIPEYVKLTNGKITQTAALAAINRTIDKDATIITAGGSLPSCMQRMWRTDKRGGYHAEYGYSCMGYEVAATLGVKFAEPDNEVYCVVGDSSFQMLHSEIMTIMQERQKVNIMVFDNCGFGCINNLEMNHGIGSLATEFRYTDGKKPTGDLIPVDYAKIGEGYGLKTYTCRTIQELVDALEDAKKQEIACLFDLKVIPKTMTDGYESWWDVGIATTSEKESVRKACEGVMKGREEARLY